MRALVAPLMLVNARARGRPGRWLLSAFGIALAAAFAGSVAAEATIAGDQSARSVLAGASPLNRTVRVTSQALLTPSLERGARAILAGLGLGAQTEVVLLNPVRLGGVVVRPAAIEPLRRWATGGSPGPCVAAACPMLLAGGKVPQATLDTIGVRVRIAGAARLRSAVPLGFMPDSTSGEPPVLLTGDATGLERLAGLSGVYRTHTWLASGQTARLHSWQLAGAERRLEEAQAAQAMSGGGFSLTAPFATLDTARAQAAAAPRRLLLAGGGALTALALFVVLAAGGLRRDQRADLARLRGAGARLGQGIVFVLAESALLCGFAVLLGSAFAIAAAAILAAAAGAPVGGVLAHSLLTPTAAGALVGVWICATATVAALPFVTGTRVADLLAAAALAALALALTLGTGSGGALPALLLAPLCCLAAGVLIFRGAAVALRAGERVARGGPVLVRLALVGLARAPAAPALAIAFIAVSTALGGFALAYRATLLRGAADQAADSVPLDATVTPGPGFTTPLQLAPLARWRAIAHGSVLPVRRTQASFVSGGAAVTVPALGVSASALPQLHGWRASDGSAPLAALARRLSPRGAQRTPGPMLPAAARSLSVQVSAPAIAVGVSAELRDGSGAIHQLSLGEAADRPRTLKARVPRGTWELQALELTEPVGLQVTNGHQNGENGGAATQFATTVSLGSVQVLGSSARVLGHLRFGGWRAVGAASAERQRGAGTVVHFSATGSPGVLRPLQPSDVHSVPVLVDAQTSASSARGGRLALTVDGEPVSAHVVGILRRFPTLPSDSAGFVVADVQTLASALDAQAPGQGGADELWISAATVSRLRAAARRGPFAQLSLSVRADLERALRSAPIARGVLGTLIAASVLAAALAVVGLLVSLLGAARNERVERDLNAQGVGPRGLRRELRLRMLLAALLGVVVGLGVAVLLTRFAVASVRAAATGAVPRPPLVTVAPWAELGLWGLGALAALTLASWASTRSLVGKWPPAR